MEVLERVAAALLRRADTEVTSGDNPTDALLKLLQNPFTKQVWTCDL
jgi:hypothetical protein